MPNRPFRKNKCLQGMLSVYAIFWLWMAIEPVDRFDWVLENLLIFAAAMALSLTYRIFAISNLSYFLILLFLSLHTIGAHYTYTTTPVDAILNDWFHFSRNNFDRVVHFSFGLLIAFPTLEFLMRAARMVGIWPHLMTVVSILAAGAFYELIEMWVAQMVAPEIGTLFLGTQGDPWDTQQDMALALYGSTLTVCVTAVVKRGRSRKRHGMATESAN
ncbi:DUF2238 domain-containing protein [Brevibacillus sp. SYP-B805]|uniref:DUF2238 domain-containing protein n=1 Tax=Brevibacillus sp. SYP-B805 TaxID=1578199 RepID=UPI0013EC1FC4|nr:DUF2238 domain-containing protein [Brevibacillus sp. SYP-B805]NGQ93616.1 DUF2238 domain-containing protein [Brevibacillus sp. SYP-B805]